jgi:hypothetical protein
MGVIQIKSFVTKCLDVVEARPFPPPTATRHGSMTTHVVGTPSLSLVKEQNSPHFVFNPVRHLHAYTQIGTAGGTRCNARCALHTAPPGLFSDGHTSRLHTNHKQNLKWDMITTTGSGLAPVRGRPGLLPHGAFLEFYAERLQPVLLLVPHPASQLRARPITLELGCRSVSWENGSEEGAGHAHGRHTDRPVCATIFAPPPFFDPTSDGFFEAAPGLGPSPLGPHASFGPSADFELAS